MEKTNKRAPRFVLAMPDELRIAIEKAAFTNGRTVTKEINIRLGNSLGSHQAPAVATVVHTQEPHASYSNQNDKSPAHALSDTDRAILAIFRAMPVEKQLALISLFK